MVTAREGARVPERESLVAELWYATAPDLSDRFCSRACGPCPRASRRRTGRWSCPTTAASCPPAPRARGGGDGPTPPLVTVVLPGSPLGHEGKSLPDASQTWDWPEVDDALGRGPGQRAGRRDVRRTVRCPRPGCGARRGRGGADRRHRSRRGRWPTSQRVTDPAAPAADGLGGLVNVRLFAVSGRRGRARDGHPRPRALRRCPTCRCTSATSSRAGWPGSSTPRPATCSRRATSSPTATRSPG